jgi:iron complex outermembrane receptor protein
VTGLRFNYDQLNYNYNEFLYTASFPPPVIYANLSSTDSHSETTVVGDVSLQHFYSRDVMTYVTYARGYAPAVYNLAEPLTPAKPKVGLARKTDIDNFEIGAKGTFLNKRLTINAAAFFTKYKNFQAQAIVPDGSVNPPSLLVSSGAETKGLEVDLNMAATNTLRVNVNLAYIDAKLKDFANAPCYYPDAPNDPAIVGDNVPPGCRQIYATNGAEAGVLQDVSGKPMPNAPRLKFTLGLEQRFPLAGDRDIVLGANYSHRDAAVMLANQNPYSIMPAIGILNLSAAFHTAGGRTSIMVFANNVTDKVYYTDLEDFWSGPWGSTNAIVGQPARDAHRYFGVRFTTGF